MTKYLDRYNIEFLNEVDSTNVYLKELLRKRNLFDSYCVSAAYQTAGKGQRQKEWHSNKNENINCSFLVNSISEVSDLSKLNNAVSLAICNTLDHFGVNNVVIKWPNDIYINDSKISGILIENVISHSKLKHCVVGIGLNVNQTEFNKFSATSMKLELLKNVDLIDVLHKLYDSLYHFVTQESHALLQSVNRILYKKNKLVTFRSEESIKTYKVLSLLDNGNLLVQENNTTKEVEHHKEKWQK